MGGDQSQPDPPPPSDSSTGTDTPSGTRTPTGTGTASITPNISDATTQSMSVSARTSRSPSDSSRPSLTSSPVRSPSAVATTTPIPLILCGNDATYEGVWKTHMTAGAAPYQKTNCLTIIYASVGQLIQFTELTQDTNPCCDSIYIYDGATASSTQLVHLIGTSMKSPYNWTSSSNTMTIQFSGFTSTTYRGVTASVKFLSGPSPTSSATSSQSSSLSPLISVSPSVSVSLSPSASSSQSSSASESISQIQSPSLLVTASEMSSISAAFSYSANSTLSPQSSISRFATVTPSLTYSIRATASPTALPSARPQGPPPPLPANLGKMSLGGLKDLLTDLSFYSPSHIQDSLRSVGFAAMQQSGGQFEASTSSFSMKMKTLDVTAHASMQVGSTNLSLPPLSSLGAGLAASMVQWTTNPYASLSSDVIDSPPLSLNILDSTGIALSVKNLTTPITFSWSLNASDPKFQVPPFYFARCDTDQIYLKAGEALSLSSAAIRTGYASWNVPCLLDLWKPLNCSDFSAFSIKTYQCPSPILTPSCLYWSSNTSSWSSDGCVTTMVNGSISCACTHLTDFTTRINAMAEANQNLFANAANVYSLAGLIKYAQWFGIFGGIAGLTLLLGLLSMRIDTLTTRKYVKSLCQDATIRTVFENAPNTAIYTFDAKSTKQHTKSAKTKVRSIETKAVVANTKELSLFQRIFQQHSRVQFLFRYDPRLARVFRLLALFTVQYHSLFITALFYGFTYGGAGKESMLWYEVLALSIVTSLLNFPVVSLILSSLNKIGLSEFKYKFPLLYEEYLRRSRFETYALKYLANKEAENTGDGDKEKSSMAQSGALDMINSQGNDAEESLIDLMFMYLCCRSPKDEDEKEETSLNNLSQKDLLVKMITIFKAKYPSCEVYDSFWSYLPCHTPEGWIFLLCSAGWLAWCLNYLILFAASQPASVGQSVMITYATSELSTVILTQPLTILITYGAYRLINIYGNRLPLFIQRFVLIRATKGVPPLFHYSNPWSHLENSLLTSRFAYSLFVKCPAIASNTSELAYAPTKAIIDDEGEESICKVEELYRDIMGVKSELQLRDSN